MLHGGRAYCCLSGIMWALSPCYNELWLSCPNGSQVSGYKGAKIKGLHREFYPEYKMPNYRIYIAVHVKDPPTF
jgi:hypothetical protein